MDFVLKPVRSLLQAIKQRLRQWTKPDSRAPFLNVALDLTRPPAVFFTTNNQRHSLSYPSWLTGEADGIFGQDSGFLRLEMANTPPPTMMAKKRMAVS